MTLNLKPIRVRVYTYMYTYYHVYVVPLCCCYPHVYVLMLLVRVYVCIIPRCILDVYLTQTLYASASASPMTYVSSGDSSLCYAMVLCL
jgi:hypothetical protein